MAVLSSAPRVLLILADPVLREPLVAAVTAAGYAADTVAPDDPRHWVRPRVDPIAVILDLSLPPVDDDERAQVALRSRDARRLPTLAVLSDQTLGAPRAVRFDDFVLTPLRPEEVLRRLQMAVQRQAAADGDHTLSGGGVVVDPARYTVELHGEAVELTFKEFELLTFLLRNAGRVFSRDVLLDKVWGYDIGGGTRTVDVHIRRLRDKLDDDDQQLIQTVRGVGYKLATGPSQPAEASQP